MTDQPDDEALSSLLLLLKSTSNKPQGGPIETTDTVDEEKRVKYTSGDAAERLSLSKTIRLEDLRHYFHLPIVEVAKQLGICTTLLKRICRNSNIRKWPYRQIKSVTKSIESLRLASLNDSLQEHDKDKYLEQIEYLERSLDALIDDPNTPLEAFLDDLETSGGDIGAVIEKWGGIRRCPGGQPVQHHEDGRPTVQQMIAAVAANASAEVKGGASSGGRGANKRARMDMGHMGGNGGMISGDGVGSDSTLLSGSAVGQHGAPAAVIEEVPAHRFVGKTTVSQSLRCDGPARRYQFLGPVGLAPLTKRPVRPASKRPVPLIEPDICNAFRMDFLPQTALQLRKRETAVAPQGSTNEQSQHQPQQSDHEVNVGADDAANMAAALESTSHSLEV